MGVEGAVAKGSGAMCGDLGAAALATGGAAEEPLGESAMLTGKFTTQERNNCGDACARHAGCLSTMRPSKMSKPTNQQNTGRRLEAALSSEELSEAANN